MGKEKYINPFTDFGFKRLFGSEFNKDLLIDFLNQVLDKRERIKDLTYLNTEHQGLTEADRRAVFDLYCENEEGEKFIIEVQNVRQEFFKDRSLFYATFPIQSQVPKGNDWDYELKAVYMVGILNFSFPDQTQQERCQREVKLMDTHTHEIFYEKLTFIYLEMPRFRKKESELVTHFDKWMYVLKNLHKLQSRPRKLQERIFEKLFEEAQIAKLNPTDMKTYQESLKALRDSYSVLETARKEGERIGEIRGEKRGEKRGEAFAQKRIAKALKDSGVSIEVIEQATGLTREQIEQL
jgi:predicted transposase/invertase (TIGR01784 family)